MTLDDKTIKQIQSAVADIEAYDEQIQEDIKKPKEMTKYEYLVDDNIEYDYELDARGREGWELVSVTGIFDKVYYFKRQI